MKRRPRKAFKLLVFLLLGAIVNVAVAWGCVYMSSRFVNFPSRLQVTPERIDTMMSYAPKGWERRSDSERLQSLGYMYDCIAGRMANKHGFYWEYVKEVRAGWPVLSLHENVHGDVARVGSGAGVKEGLRVFGHHFMPVKPLWIGFAINTIFYAAILYALFALPGAVRRRVRIKRGQCAACGYSLQGSQHREICPECGATT